MRVSWNPEADTELTEAAFYYADRVATWGPSFWTQSTRLWLKSFATHFGIRFWTRMCAGFE